MPAATRRSTGQPDTSVPAYCTLPAEWPVWGKEPMTAFSMVDLPAPLAPITVTILPAGTVSVAPASAPTLP
ncbi:hypothetical protein D3C72_2346940 [compost metagenome]